MKKIGSILILMGLFFTNKTISQSVISLYGDTTKYRNTGWQQFYSATIGLRTIDGGDVFVSVRDSFYNKSGGKYAGRINILKTRPNGNVDWSKNIYDYIPFVLAPPLFNSAANKCYNFGNENWNGPSIAQSVNGNFAVVAVTNGNDTCNFPDKQLVANKFKGFALLFVLLDNMGNVSKSFTWRPSGTPLSGIGSSNFPGVISTSDGGFLSWNDMGDSTGIGLTTSFIKVDNLGNIQWQKSVYVTGATFSSTKDIIQTCDNGFLMVGQFNGGASFGQIIKFDQNGTVQWSKKYATSYVFFNKAVALDNGYAIGGFALNNAMANRFASFLMKIDLVGNVVWSKTYSHPTGSITLENSGVIKRHLGDGLEIMNHITDRNGVIPEGFMISKVDNNGNLIYSNAYQTASYGYSMRSGDISKDACNGYRVYGYTSTGRGLSTGWGEYNTQLVRAVVDTAGKNGCEVPVSLSSGTLPLSVSNNIVNTVNQSHFKDINLTTYSVNMPEYVVCSNSLPSIACTSPIILNSSKINDATCPLNADGNAYALASKGSCPYNYSWSNNTTNDTLTNVLAGIYTVTVTDASGFTQTQTVSINSPSAIIANATQNALASCGLSNGIAVVSASGGNNISYSYNWSNGVTGTTASQLPAASYTVTVTDGNNCSTTTTVNINNSPAPIINTLSPDNPLCSNQSGSATVNATGTGTLTYSWSNGNIGTTATGLTTGNYTVTVTDGNGCKAIQTTSITQPPAITLGSITPTAASCGQSNGTAVTAIATGGTGTLTYSWSNGNSGQTASNLSAQTYTLTVRDANNCSTTTTVNIGNAGGASISSINKTDALCNGGTGSATVNITGGASGNYTYSWSNGANTITTATSNQELLTSNTYTVTVIDGSCTVTSVVSITQPTPIVASAIQNTPASCGLNNGEAIASATGGNNSNYNYVWSNGTTTSTATGLSAGTYIITVTDANNCAQTTSVNISNSPAPTINSLTAVNPLCNGATGTASVTATGTGTLTYVWSNGNTTTTATNLTAGNYNITVTDGNGCKAIQSFSITEPSAITISNPIITNASCNQSNGNISITASGGTGILTYSWSNGNSGLTASNLSAQTYTLTVNDANNCSTTTTASINSIGGANISNVTKVDALCNSSIGSATVTITPSAAPYTYNWSNGASTITTATSNQEQLTSNTYTVTITDANNCSTTTTVQINQPTVLSIATPITTDASCNQSNGSISITATGGTTPYTYSWSNGATSITTSTTSQISNLVSQVYSLTVTDANNCSTSTSITINNTNSSVNATVTSTISSNTISEGESIVLSAGGGTSYTWTPNNSLSCATCPVTIANPTATTTYTLIAKDNLGCADTTDITINVKKPCTGEEDVFIANVFSPNNDGKNDVLQIQGNGLTNIYFSIYDRWGNQMFETRDQAQGWDGSVNGNTANAGTYVYYLKATCKKTLQEIILKGNVSIVK